MLEKIFKKIIKHFILIATFTPLMLSLIGSFAANENLSNGLSLDLLEIKFPLQILHNLKSVDLYDILPHIFISISIALLTSLIVVVVSLLLGFYISRYFRVSNNQLLIFICCFYSVPAFVLSFAGYYVNLAQHFLFCYFTYLLVLCVFLLPFSVWFTLKYFEYVPYSFDRQARMDGAGNLKLIFKIIFPFLKPVLSVLYLICFIISFNDTLFSIGVSKSEAMRSLNHYIMESIYENDQMNQFGTLLAIGWLIECGLILFAVVVIKRFNKFLIKNN